MTAHVPGAVRFNERFKQLVRHYGFVPKACRSYRPRTKGKVERNVGYAKQHFFQRYRSQPSLRSSIMGMFRGARRSTNAES